MHDTMTKRQDHRSLPTSVAKKKCPAAGQMSQVNRSDIKKSPSGPRESRQAGMVLLVDDDAIALELTSTMLSMLGFTVLRAMDGLEAVEVFRRHRDEIRFGAQRCGHARHERLGNLDRPAADRTRHTGDSGQWLQCKPGDGQCLSRAAPDFSGKTLWNPFTPGCDSPRSRVGPAVLAENIRCESGCGQPQRCRSRRG